LSGKFFPKHLKMGVPPVPAVPRPVNTGDFEYTGVSGGRAGCAGTVQGPKFKVQSLSPRSKVQEGAFGGEDCDDWRQPVCNMETGRMPVLRIIGTVREGTGGDPKPEIRRSKEIRSPKSETNSKIKCTSCLGKNWQTPAAQISGTPVRPDRLSAFGFRPLVSQSLLTLLGSGRPSRRSQAGKR
jgi:hypothetical protein